MNDSTGDYIELMRECVKEDQKSKVDRYVEFIKFISELYETNLLERYLNL